MSQPTISPLQMARRIRVEEIAREILKEQMAEHGKGLLDIKTLCQMAARRVIEEENNKTR